jgi:hypothetical protein
MLRSQKCAVPATAATCLVPFRCAAGFPVPGQIAMLTVTVDEKAVSPLELSTVTATPGLTGWPAKANSGWVLNVTLEGTTGPSPASVARSSHEPDAATTASAARTPTRGAGVAMAQRTIG